MASSSSATTTEKIQAYLGEQLTSMDLGHLKSKFGRKIKVLSIGCGYKAEEIGVLLALAKKLDIDLEIHAIDIDQACIDACTERYRGIENVKFHAIDATQGDVIKKLTRENGFHIIIARHPVFSPGNEATKSFEIIFSKTIPDLLLEGSCLITSFFRFVEDDACLSLMRHVTEVKPHESEENRANYMLSVETSLSPFPEPLYADRYLAYFKDFKPNNALRAEKMVLPSEYESQLVDLANLIFKLIKENKTTPNLLCLFKYLLRVISTAELSADKSPSQLMREIHNKLDEFKSEEKSTPDVDDFLFNRLIWNIIKNKDNDEQLIKIAAYLSQTLIKIILLLKDPVAIKQACLDTFYLSGIRLRSTPLSAAPSKEVMEAFTSRVERGFLGTDPRSVEKPVEETKERKLPPPKSFHFGE